MAKKKTEERKHALLSASAAERWIACPPSARLEETLPDTTSDAAIEGTLAHEICELKMKKQFTEQVMTSKTYNTRMNKLKKREKYDPEMEGYTDAYVEYISEIAYSYATVPTIIVEKKVDYGSYAPEGFGTADCILISGSECHVIDFKYGKGKTVDAEGNPQLGLYALGVLGTYSIIYDIQKVYLHVIQPRLNRFLKWETNAEELRAWGQAVIKPKAELAFKGEGEFKTGKHCGFCRAAATCRKQKEDNIALARHEFQLPPLISNEEIGTILEKAQQLEVWVKKLQKHALAEVLRGAEVPGWKAVEGRSNRKITDFYAAYEELQKAGYDKALLYEEKPITLTQVEKILDKADKENILNKFIVKPAGAPTLAPVSDKREPITNTAEQDFGTK